MLIMCFALVGILALAGCGASGGGSTLCDVPNCIGKDHDDAHALIVNAGLVPVCIPGCSMNEDWHVYYQRPKAGARYTCEQMVELYYK